MKVGDNASLNWTEKIESKSMLRDALGIWSDHLSIQEEFTQGITSVTQRARYYTIWAYYYQYLYDNEIITPKNYEKIFILASLACHNGDNQSPELLHMYNNQKFAGKWDEIDNFSLNSFDIIGQGYTYYNRQMQVFRCAWTDELNQTHKTEITKQLADTLKLLDVNSFKKDTFSKKDLKKLFGGFSISQISENSEEQNILSKLFFGFFCQKGNDWIIDEDTFNLYMNGNGTFSLSEKNDNYSFSEHNIKRRNTLLFFLKVVNETEPDFTGHDLNRCLWDASYFRQNRTTDEIIDFGELEETREYWEWFQFNLYYVFIMEKLLERIQQIVMANIGIDKKNLIQTLDKDYLFSNLRDKIKIDVNEDTSLYDIYAAVKKIVATPTTFLYSELNEGDCYDALFTDDNEEFISETLIFLCLLWYRYDFLEDFSDEDDDYSSLISDSFFKYLSNNGSSLQILPFISELFQTIVNRHLLISAIRYTNGTQNWIFSEEEGRLQSVREKIHISSRDNRWHSIRSILLDLNFLTQNDNSQLILTQKGQKWLELIK